MSITKKTRRRPKPPAIPRLDANATKFVANGNTYFIQGELSVERWVQYNKLSLELAFGTDFKGMYDTLHKIWNASASGNDLIGAIHRCKELAYNQLNAIVELDKHQYPTVMRFCALFINGEGEDRARWDEPVIEAKIQDWIDEGIAVSDFFVLAGNFVPGLRTAYSELLQRAISEGKEPPLSNKDTMQMEGGATSPEAQQKS